MLKREQRQPTIQRLLVLVLLLAVALGISSYTRQAYSRTQDPCAQERKIWVGHALMRMESIKPGMTRGELLKVFTVEGGLSTGLRRTFVSRDCPYFKVDVEFSAVGRPDRDKNGRVTLVEDSRDIIISVSRPYLQFSIVD